MHTRSFVAKAPLDDKRKETTYRNLIMSKKNKNKPNGPTQMALDLPPAVRVFWETAPEAFRIPAILTAIVCYCALATRVRAKYVYDIELHALLVQLLVIGEPGSGKSFTRPIVKQIMASSS